MNTLRVLALLLVACLATFCSSNNKKSSGTSRGQNQGAQFQDTRCPPGYVPRDSTLGTAPTGGFGPTATPTSTPTWQGSGGGLSLQSPVQWEPTVRQALATSCATSRCHDSITRAGTIDLSNEFSARPNIPRAIAAVNAGRMPPSNPNFASTNPTFVQTLQSWQSSGGSGVAGANPLPTPPPAYGGNGVYSDCVPAPTTSVY